MDLTELSTLIDAVNCPQSVAPQVVWSEGCLRLVAYGERDGQKVSVATWYEVELEGGEVLYRSNSYHAAQHFLEILTEPYQRLTGCVRQGCQY